MISLIKVFVLSGVLFSMSVLSSEVKVAKSSLDKAIEVAKTTDEYMPVWQEFINTKFYVLTTPLDEGDKTSNFRFNIYTIKGQPTIILSENLDRIAATGIENKAIQVSGGKVIQMLNPDVAIMVALEQGGFGLPKDIVDWLRNSLSSH
jgi:hypothetical protein